MSFGTGPTMTPGPSTKKTAVPVVALAALRMSIATYCTSVTSMQVAREQRFQGRSRHERPRGTGLCSRRLLRVFREPAGKIRRGRPAIVVGSRHPEPPVVRQNLVPYGTIDDSARGLDSCRPDASPPCRPPADAPLSHAPSARPRARELGPSPTTCQPGLSTTPHRSVCRPALLGSAAPILGPLGGRPRHRPA
jgi:hypothetical protein